MVSRANWASGCAMWILIAGIPVAIGFAAPMAGVATAVLCLPIIFGTWSSGGSDGVLCLLGSGLGYLKGGWGG